MHKKISRSKVAGIATAWCPYNRYDRYSSKRIQRSERSYGNRALSDRSIAMVATAEIENLQSQRSLSARFPYNRSDRGVFFLSYRSDYMNSRLTIPMPCPKRYSACKCNFKLSICISTSIFSLKMLKVTI